MFSSPTDPSIFDTVQFNAFVFDARLGFGG